MPLHEQFVDVFRTVFNDHSLVLADDMTADDIPAWDSVRHINLVFLIERRFGVRFTTDELANLRRVGDLKKCVAAKLNIEQNA